MTLVAPHLAKVRGTGADAESSQRVVLAAADYLSSKHKRTALAEMYQHIVADDPTIKPDIRVRVIEAECALSKQSARYRSDRNRFGERTLVRCLGLTARKRPKRCSPYCKQKKSNGRIRRIRSTVQIYRTKISDNYAIVLGGQMRRSDAVSLASAARQKGLAPDAFAQQDRSWTFVENATAR